MSIFQLAWHIICYTGALICALIGGAICFGIGAFIAYMFTPSHTVAVISGSIGAAAFVIVMLAVGGVVRAILDDVWPNRP